LINPPYPLFTLKHNPEKSDPQYYQIMLQHFNFTPVEVVCFENEKHSVASATAVGITVYHYDRNEQDIKKLKEFLDEHL
jgi:FMN phosphatase YigB (HAD superfamily)